MPEIEVKDNPFDLRQMIAAENDPRQRVLLMLVQQGNDRWAENTRAVQENAAAVQSIAKDLEALFTSFEERTKTDDALKNQGKGAGRILLAVIGAAQIIGLAVWTDTRADVKEANAALISSKTTAAVVEARLASIEAVVRSWKTQP